MNKINNLKNKIKKLVTIVAVLCALAFVSQVKAYPHILLKGLFKALKNDDIGFAHALLHSRWIENLYQYGAGSPHKKVKIKKGKDTTWKAQEGQDPVANLVRRFWFRKKENHLLMPTQFGCLANIPDDQWGRMFGMLMNYVYRGCNIQEETVLLDTIFSYDPQAEQFEQDLHELCKALEIEEARLKDEKFDQVKQAHQELKKARYILEKHYNIGLFKEEMSDAKKNCKGKALTRKKKELKEKYDKARYVAALRKAKKEIFEKISQELQDEYDQIGGKKKKLEVKVNKKLSQKRDLVRKTVCEPIREALRFCKRGDMYAPRTTESILWALFFHRLDGFISLKTKIRAINDCLTCMDLAFKNKEFEGMLGQLYSKEDIITFGEKILTLTADQQSKVLSENYEQALHYLIYCTKGILPPVVTQGKFGYEYEPGKISHVRPNCHETAILDLFSILWHNPKKREYDNSLFKDHIIQEGEGFKRLREAIKYFYLADRKGIDASKYTCEYEVSRPDGSTEKVQFTSLEKLKSLGEISEEEVKQLRISEVPVEYINRSEVKQEFMNIVSGIEGIIYKSKVTGKGTVFEIRSMSENVLRVCNYFYGTNVQDIGELTGRVIGLSTDSRIVAFRKKNRQDSVRVNIEDHENNAEFNLVVKIGATHTNLVVFDRDKKPDCLLQKGVARHILKKIGGLLKEDAPERKKFLSLFMLLDTQDLLKDNTIVLPLPILQLLFYSQIMKKGIVKFALIEDILTRYPQSYESCKEMIHNLIKKFPKNNQELKVKLAELIIRTGFYNNPIFQNFIKFKVLNDERVYENTDRVSDILWVAIERGYKNLVHEIIAHPCFNNFAHALWIALELEKKELMLDIAKSSNFKAKFKDLKIVFNELLEKGYIEVIIEILNKPQFKIQYSELRVIIRKLLEKGDTQIIIAILNSRKFKANRFEISKILNLAVEKGYQEIVFAILSHPTFKHFFLANDNDNNALQFLEKLCITLGKTKIGELFELEDDVVSVADMLTLLLERGYKNIAMEIINFPAFSMHFDGIGVFLKWALETGYIDFVLAVIKDPNFRADFPEVLNIIRLAGQKGYKTIVDAIVQHPTFYDFFDEAGEVLIELLQQGYTDVLQEKLKHERHKPQFKVLIKLLRLAINKSDQKLALEIIKHMKFSVFEVNENKIVDALKLVLEKGYTEIALALVKKCNASYVYTTYGFREFLVLLLQDKKHPEVTALMMDHEDEYSMFWGDTFDVALLDEKDKEVAREIMHHPKFGGWGQALGAALEADAQDLVKEIMSHSKFDIGKAGDALEAAVKKGNIKIALAIVNAPAFDLRTFFYVDALKKSLKMGYLEVFLKIFNSHHFYAWGDALKAALKYGYKKIALRVIKNPLFIPEARQLGESLILSLESPEYQEMGQELLKRSDFNVVWEYALGYAFKRGYEDVAVMVIKKLKGKFNYYHLGLDSLGQEWGNDNFEIDCWVYTFIQAIRMGYEKVAREIVRHPNFNMVNIKDIGYLLKEVLKREYKDLALAIVTHKTFWVDGYNYYSVGNAWVFALTRCQAPLQRFGGHQGDRWYQIALNILKKGLINYLPGELVLRQTPLVESSSSDLEDYQSLEENSTQPFFEQSNLLVEPVLQQTLLVEGQDLEELEVDGELEFEELEYNETQPLIDQVLSPVFNDKECDHVALIRLKMYEECMEAALATLDHPNVEGNIKFASFLRKVKTVCI